MRRAVLAVAQWGTAPSSTLGAGYTRVRTPETGSG